MEDGKLLGKQITGLARESIRYYLQTGEILPCPLDLHPYLLQERRGVFVSLKKGETLRGCIGTFIPQQKNIAEEIIYNAVSAAIQDPRFPPVRKGELQQLRISVDILSEPERVRNLDELDPSRYGIIVESGWKKGLLLPDIEGVNSVEEQVRIASAKAGISPGQSVVIYRFTVDRFREEDYW